MTYISRWNNYQTPVSSWISTFQDKEERVKEVQGCTLDVGDFKNTLTFRFKADKKRTGFILNRIKLVRKS